MKIMQNLHTGIHTLDSKFVDNDVYAIKFIRVNIAEFTIITIEKWKNRSLWLVLMHDGAPLSLQNLAASWVL